jgi:hypothetical protein
LSYVFTWLPEAYTNKIIVPSQGRRRLLLNEVFVSFVTFMSLVRNHIVAYLTSWVVPSYKLKALRVFDELRGYIVILIDRFYL